MTILFGENTNATKIMFPREGDKGMYIKKQVQSNQTDGKNKMGIGFRHGIKISYPNTKALMYLAGMLYNF